MALVVKDRVKETTTTTGTGAVTLLGAVTGFQSFSAIGNANTTYYTISDGTNWEVGIGTYTAAGTSLSRDTVLSSSNSDLLVNFPAGTKEVFVTYPSSKSIYQNGSSISSGTAILPVSNGGTGASTLTANGVLLGNGTSAVSATAAGTTGQVLVGNTGYGPSWATLSSSAVTSFSAGTTGLTPSMATTGAITLAGTLNVANGGTGATSLTSGYLVKGNGTSAVSASVVYDDGTNVGIGTNSPSAKMELQTTGAYSAYFQTGVDQSSHVALRRISLTAINFRAAIQGQSLSGTWGADDLLINPSGGNVGIGGTPSGKFDVQGADGNAVYFRTATSTATGAQINLKTSNSSTVPVYGFFYNGTTGMGNPGANIISFINNGTERARIDSSGNVGIGTSSPAQRIHAATTAAPTGTTQSFLRLTGDATYGADFGGGLIQGVGPIATISTISAGTATERMRIDGSGNVGIGAISPTQRLHVRQDQNGTTAALIQNRNATGSPVSAVQFISGAFDLSDNRYAMIASDGGSNTTLQFWTGQGATPTERMRIDSSGNVGIGTSSPQVRVHISTVDQSTNRVRLQNTGTGGGNFDIIGGLAGVSNAGLSFYDVTNAATRMYIDSSGNVGIGTSSPANKLDVNGSVNIGASLISGGNVSTGDTAIELGGNRSGSGNSYIDFHSTAGTDYEARAIRGGGANGAFDIVNSGTGDFTLNAAGAAALRFSTTGTERMRITSAGDVGIGATSLNGKFHVETTSTGDVIYIAANTGGTAGQSVYVIPVRTAGTLRGGIQWNGTNLLYNNSSDTRLKENIADADDAASLIDAIQVRKFDWKENGSHQRYGFIAQELIEVAPEAVHQPEDAEEMMGVDYSKLVPMLIKEVQSLRARVAQLEGK